MPRKRKRREARVSKRGRQTGGAQSRPSLSATAGELRRAPRTPGGGAAGGTALLPVFTAAGGVADLAVPAPGRWKTGPPLPAASFDRSGAAGRR